MYTIDDRRRSHSLPALVSTKKELSLPDIKGEYLLVADLDTREILLNKEATSEIYVNQVTKIMLALAASDNVDLEKRIVARKWMFAEFEEGIMVPQKSYVGYDLLSPLLLQ